MEFGRFVAMYQGLEEGGSEPQPRRRFFGLVSTLAVASVALVGCGGEWPLGDDQFASDLDDGDLDATCEFTDTFTNTHSKWDTGTNTWSESSYSDTSTDSRDTRSCTDSRTDTNSWIDTRTGKSKHVSPAP